MSGEYRGCPARAERSADLKSEVVRPHRSRRASWALRLAGSLFGLGAWAVGLYSLLGWGEAVSELGRERALGYGVVALVVGTVAIVGSLATRDVHALWYCTPRRWRLFRDSE